MESALEGELQRDASVTLGESALVESEELATLIAEGQERGVLSNEAIVAALDEADATREQAAELYAFLEEQGIEVLGREEAAESEPAVPAAAVAKASQGSAGAAKKGK